MCWPGPSGLYRNYEWAFLPLKFKVCVYIVYPQDDFWANRRKTLTYGPPPLPCPCGSPSTRISTTGVAGARTQPITVIAVPGPGKRKLLSFLLKRHRRFALLCHRYPRLGKPSCCLLLIQTMRRLRRRRPSFGGRLFLLYRDRLRQVLSV